MSHTYSIVCHSRKLKLWIGQGWEAMTCFYSGLPEVMDDLHFFLRITAGDDLRVVRDDDPVLEDCRDVGGREEDDLMQQHRDLLRDALPSVRAQCNIDLAAKIEELLR